MKRAFTEDSALKIMRNNNAGIVGKVIIVEGFDGLKACSAFDFLKKKCGYRGILKSRLRPN